MTVFAPKICFLGSWDWANLCNRIARAINAFVGERVARVYTTHAHPFGYPEDMIAGQCNPTELTAAARAADWVISTGDGDYRVFQELLRDLPLKRDVRRGVTHAGTAYRLNASVYNALDADLGARARFIGSDSLYLADGDLCALPYIGTCDLAPALPVLDGTLRVTHSPTAREAKGTAEILLVLERLQAENRYAVDLIEHVPPAEVPARRLRAHVHVDQLNARIGGFGQSAIEAMGAGCLTLADIRHVGPEVAAYIKRPPILDVRNARELEDWLRLLYHERDVLDRLRVESWKWSQRYSAPDAVARYWLLHLNRLG